MWLGGWHGEGVLWGAQQRGRCQVLLWCCAGHQAACGGGLQTPLFGDPAPAWLQVLPAPPAGGSWAGQRVFSLGSSGSKCTRYEFGPAAEVRFRLTFSEE